MTEKAMTHGEAVKEEAKKSKAIKDAMKTNKAAVALVDDDDPIWADAKITPEMANDEIRYAEEIRVERVASLMGKISERNSSKSGPLT